MQCRIRSTSRGTRTCHRQRASSNRTSTRRSTRARHRRSLASSVIIRLTLCVLRRYQPRQAILLQRSTRPINYRNFMVRRSRRRVWWNGRKYRSARRCNYHLTRCQRGLQRHDLRNVTRILTLRRSFCNNLIILRPLLSRRHRVINVNNLVGPSNRRFSRFIGLISRQ